jgi:hypothetical protein
MIRLFIEQEKGTILREYNPGLTTPVFKDCSKSVRLHEYRVENVRGATANHEAVELEDKKPLG